MDDLPKILFVLSYGYLLGSINSAFIVGKVAKGLDLRKTGTGTLGAANVWYHVGRFWIFPVGVFDLFIKGMTPVYLARYGLDLDLGIQAAAGILAILGHNWPVFLKFHGGRGIAPTVGVLLALARMELLIFIVVATAGWRLTDHSARWGLIGLLVMPLAAFLWDKPLPIQLTLILFIVIVILKRLFPDNKLGGAFKTRNVFLNRMMNDRDIDDHDSWVNQNR